MKVDCWVVYLAVEKVVVTVAYRVELMADGMVLRRVGETADKKDLKVEMLLGHW